MKTENKTNKILEIDENHEYKLDNDKIPGVHEIMSNFKLVNFEYVNQETLDQAIELGTNVHIASERAEMGLEYDKNYKSYIESIKKFKSIVGTKECVFSEFMCWSDFGFACTIDRVFKMDNGEHWIVDYKTGGVYKTTKLQTAANAIALEHTTGIKADKRGALYLKKDGSFKFKEHDDDKDYQIWINFVENFHWSKPRYSKTKWKSRKQHNFTE